ncbi:hypothetical protein L7F22_029167 [Adiantum nelumboides]|nr:hypothetical protein [Adiantum nelumboides]
MNGGERAANLPDVGQLMIDLAGSGAGSTGRHVDGCHLSYGHQADDTKAVVEQREVASQRGIVTRLVADEADLRQQLEGSRAANLVPLAQDTANTIYTDSQSALAVARNPVFHARTKHIEVHCHYVRERLSAGEISLAYVPTEDNLANLFTKALSREKLEAFRKALGLLPFVD